MATTLASSFAEKLKGRIVATGGSLLCVGLDPHESDLTTTTAGTLTEDSVYTFCKTLIDATADYAVCYKPNGAFFEKLGPSGHACLHRVCGAIPSDIPIILDVKRGDIGSTAHAYAEAAYSLPNVDAVTLSPLMGWDSAEPFVSGPYQNKGAFLLCKTSNPGSNELLTLPVQSPRSTTTTSTTKHPLLYEVIAQTVGTAWRHRTTACLGLVVGATDPEAVARARSAAGDDTWILAPGVGAQGGELEATLQAAKYTNILIPVSRGISRASSPRDAAKELAEKIATIVKANQCLETTRDDAAEVLTVQPYQKEFIEFSLETGVLKFGRFVLKSGRTSPFFFNAGLFCTGKALFQLAKAYAHTVMSSPVLSQDGKPKFDVLFGPAYKGISLGALVAGALYSDFGVDVGFAYNRKEAKDHGEGGTLVGAPMSQKRVLIVDDVITAGTAIREAHGLLTAVGAQPMGVVIALDRDEIRALDDTVSAVQAASRDLNIDVVSIIKLGDLQTYLEWSNHDDAILLSVVEYRKQYGSS